MSNNLVMNYDASKMYKMCFRKGRYRTWDKACKAAVQMTEKYGKKQRAYYCPICNSYHLTTK